MKESKEKIRQMVAYLLNCKRTEDKETIDNYTDSIMLGADVSKRRELLLDFAEYSENDKTSEHLDELVDNYLDSVN